MLESLVTSLDLSRQLKEAGCSQDSYFCWVPGEEHPMFWSDALEIHGVSFWSLIAAYTAEELLRLLPPGSVVYRPGVHTNEWLAETPGFDLMDEGNWTGAETAANAAAKLYLALKERGLV